MGWELDLLRRRDRRRRVENGLSFEGGPSLRKRRELMFWFVGLFRRFTAIASSTAIHFNVSPTKVSWFVPTSLFQPSRSFSRSRVLTIFPISFVSFRSTRRLVNITNLFFLVTTVLVPTLVQRYNPRNTVIGASILLVVSGWIRYASSAPSLQSGEKAWGVLLGSQVLVGLSQPFTLCIGSE